MHKLKGRYNLIDVSTTHNQMLFRCFSAGGGNTDLLFEGVKALNCFWSFTNPEFELSTLTPFGPLDPMRFSRNILTVSIKCDEGTFFVLLDRIQISNLSFEGDETSIPCKLSGEEDDENFAKFMADVENGNPDAKFVSTRTSNWSIILS